MDKEQNPTAEAINWILKRLPVQLVDNKNVETVIETYDIIDHKPVEPSVIMRIKGKGSLWHAVFTDKSAEFKPKKYDRCDILGFQTKTYCPKLTYFPDLPGKELNGLQICPHYYLCIAIEKFVEKYDREIKEINKLNNEKLDM
jgi:hypothetical protein